MRKVPQSRKGFPQAPLGRVGEKERKVLQCDLEAKLWWEEELKRGGEELGIMASSAASSEYHTREIEGDSSNSAALPKSLMMMRSPLGSTTSMYDFVKVQQPHSTIFTSSFQTSQIDSNVGQSSFQSSQAHPHLHKLISILTN
jgi:hypothetical protein